MQSNVTYILAPTALTEQVLQSRELRTKYETNRLLPLYDTYLCLKHWCGQPGVVTRMYEAATFCKISYTTLERRLRQMSALGWVTYNEATDVFKLNSWRMLFNYFQINYKHDFVSIPYIADNKERLQDRLFTVSIESNKLLQHRAWLNKLNKHHEHKDLLIVGCIQHLKSDAIRLQKDHSYFVDQIQQLYIKDFRFGSDIQSIIQLYRPFFERGIKAMQHAYCYKSKQSISYRKKVLATRGVIEVQKQKHTSTIRGRNKHCWVIWNKTTQQTTMCMADTIVIIKPKKQAENELQQHKSA